MNRSTVKRYSHHDYENVLLVIGVTVFFNILMSYLQIDITDTLRYIAEQINGL